MYNRSLNDEDKKRLMQDKEYELYVKDILEKINAADNWENTKLEHDVTLTGKSGTKHQIDIYWEFKYGLITHKVAVECKGYNNPVTKGLIAAFHGVLEDLDGVQGVYASQMGYQSGAEKLAKQFSIKLLEIRRPMSKDVKGRLWNIGIKIQMPTRANERFNMILAKEDMGQDVIDHFEGYVNPNIEYILDNEERKTIQAFLLGLQPINENRHQCFEIERENLYYLMDDRPVRIKKLIYEYDFKMLSHESEIRGDSVIKALVRDLFEDREKTVSWMGSVSERSSE